MAPPRILESMFSESSDLWTENGMDLRATPGWRIMGEIEFGDPGRTLLRVKDEVNKMLKMGARVISLGGDHSITSLLERLPEIF